jgi:hypothetical protein
MKKTGNAGAAEAIAADEALRKRAARQAVKTEVQQADAQFVTCRVLPKGDNKISMGQHVAGIGEAHYERGETFKCEAEIAAALEERGFAEIVADAA